MSKMILVDETPMKFQIWDTAGQEKVGSGVHVQHPPNQCD